VKKVTFCEDFIFRLKEDETLDSCFILVHQATLHLCGIVNNVTCALKEGSCQCRIRKKLAKAASLNAKVHGPFSFPKTAVAVITYLFMLHRWLWPV
jgi:hypothetical protein